MDTSWSQIAIQVATVLLLVLANGFFVAAEFSLVTVRRSRVEQLLREGRPGAARLAGILKDLDTVISSTQLGITMASLALGWAGEPFLASLFEPFLHFLPVPAIWPAAHTLAVAAAFTIITFLHIVLGELAPKSLALQRAEAVAFKVSGPMSIFTRIFRPFIIILNGAGNSVLRAIGAHGARAHELVHSEEELRIILSESEASGVLEEGETEIIQRIFDFPDITARQVMVPRTEMSVLPLDAGLDMALDMALREDFTRFPVYKNDIDDLVGVVHVKDIMRAATGRAAGAFEMSKLVRPALILPEVTHVDDLMAQLRRNKTHMAILVDEFGGTAGLVTMQDLLEEIVGDVADEFEENEIQIQHEADGSILLNGKLLIQDVIEELGLSLNDGNYVTIGGMVFGLIGRRPRVGDEVALDDQRLRVEAVDGLRVALVRLLPAVQDAHIEA